MNKLFSVVIAGVCCNFVYGETSHVGATGVAPFELDITNQVDVIGVTQFGSGFAPDEKVSLEEEVGNGWYMIPSAGVNLIEDTNDLGINVQYDTGSSFGVGIGVELATKFRLQFDINYTDNDVDPFTFDAGLIDPSQAGNPVTASGNITQLSLMINGIFDLSDKQDKVRPYVGLGIGSTRVSEEVSLSIPGLSDTSFYGSDWGGTWQIVAGASFSVSDSGSFYANYRYANVRSEGDDYRNSTITLGYKFQF